jgi:hypothetical protein
MVDEAKLGPPVVPRRRWPFTRRQIILQVVLAAVILGSGIAIGAGGAILVLRDRIIWRFPPRPPGGRHGPPDLVAAWTEEYDLTAEQARQIQETLAKQFAAIRELWTDLATKEQAEREKFVQAMKSILTPEQFETWHEDLKERERHFPRWRPRGPGGPDRPGGPGRPSGPNGPGRPDGRRDHGPRSMRGPEPPPEGPPKEPPTE